MSVLILGATSRVANRVARRYAEAGHPVYLAEPEVAEAERIAADLAIRTGVQTRCGAFDATDFDTHPTFVDAVEEAVGPIDVALVAFGFMGDQAASEEDFAAAQRVIDINYTGAVSICEALARKMAERGSGSIIGISSVAGDRGRRSNYFYGSAKGAFRLYLQGLRGRMHEHGVHVMTVRLGFVDTRMTFGLKTGIPIASPEAVARALYRAQQRKVDSLYYPPFWAGIMGIINAIPESVFKRLSL
jgi:short-subunit dehydrogenase